MILELVSQEIQLKQVTGNEYAGPCPWCGGTDRLHIWPEDDRWKCLGYDEGRNGCGKGGDAIQWLRDKRGLTFQDAADLVGKPTGDHSTGILHHSTVAPTLKAPEPVDHPTGRWQDRAWSFLNWTQEQMDTESGGKAEHWLAMRGLNASTVHQAGIGYCPEDTYTDRAGWGLEPEASRYGKLKRVWTPRGIVIPWTFGGHIWRIRFRRPLTCAQAAKGEAKYIQLPGSANGLYGARELATGKAAVLVESELDALLLKQEAGDLCVAVATGGTAGARRAKWIGMLATAPRVLIAYDADEAGERAAQWWKGTLPNGRIWRPLWGDQTDMLKDGANLRDWLTEGLK